MNLLLYQKGFLLYRQLALLDVQQITHLMDEYPLALRHSSGILIQRVEYCSFHCTYGGLIYRTLSTLPKRSSISFSMGSLGFAVRVQIISSGPNNSTSITNCFQL